MDTLRSARVAGLLTELHGEAEVADRSLKEQITAALASSGKSLEDLFVGKLAGNDAGFNIEVGNMAERFLSVSSDYGCFLYMCARACRAKCIVEFGTSMGISAIYLAAALRDNGGGQLIGTEILPSKAMRARANVEAAGLSDLVDIREGDALTTLRRDSGEVDLMLLDGAFPLYLPVLKLIEPRLRNGAFILAENAIDRDYLNYVRNPANGYLSQAVAVDESRGNELTMVIR